LTAHINIGSNLGHRAELIARAVSLLAGSIGRVERVSSPVESAAWGYESDNVFLNVGVNVNTDLVADEIVGRLKRIEREIDPAGTHRDSDGNYVDRMIDLDLICLDNVVSSSEIAQVPHPHMQAREFVLRPMAEILPDWVHPASGKNAAKMLAELCNKKPCGAV